MDKGLQYLSLFFLAFTIICLTGCNYSFSNKDILLSDPTIFEEDGKYYLYGTSSGGLHKTNKGFHVFKSDDLNNWKPHGYALRYGDAYGEKGFWAPHVLKNNDTYIMVYTTDENIAMAFSKSATGPFKNEMKPILKQRKTDRSISFENGKYFLFSVKKINDEIKFLLVNLPKI